MFTGLSKYESTRPDEFWSTTVPAHWQVVPGMAALTENKARNTGLTESQVLSLSYGRVIMKPVEEQRGLVPDSYEGYQILEPGDIVIRPTDLQNDQRSIRVGRVRDRGIITSAYIGLRSKQPWTADYAYLYLMAVDSTKRIYGMGSGLRQQLGWSDLKRMPCLAPPVDEQAAIVQYLAHANARIDKAVVAKRRLIDLLEEKKMALLARVIGGATGVRMRLKHVASIQTGLTLGKDYGEQPLSEYPYLRVANVQMGHVDTTDVATVTVPTAEAERCTLRAGDVLMTEGGDIDKLGRGTVWDGSVDGCLHQNHVFAVRCGAQLLPEFLAAWLAAPEPRFYFYVTAKKTTNLAATNSTTVRGLPMVVPPVYEQRRLLALLSAQSAPVDLAKAKAAREIELLREFRGRLVADVVTGQVDVRELAGSLPEATEVSTPVGILNDAAELEIKGVLEMSEV